MIRLATSMALALCLSFLPHTVSAATYSIGSMNITGGSVVVDGFLPAPAAFNYIGPNTNLVGGYIGSGGASLLASAYDPYGIASFDWYGSPVSLYTAAASLGDTLSPAGTFTGGPVPSGTLDNVAGTITLDLSSLFGTWNDGDFITGTGRNDGVTWAMATGTWNPVTHAYTLYWDSRTMGQIACVNPDECISHWVLEGTASPVPVPATFWLFGSGLLGLIGVLRRRKSENN
ncbi:hypothetical protein SCL_0281 [Sulfuricaulis limicola]|uniref:Ice-binding protein C-terminal domain-containing protein n=1 Tax=Sulfuricaulis limicola TaxID=1620215 RepID=A0A1B4XCQ2_9GAMM|nr:PEP-CTERM sorting domain-containing protein [Sulfuricaulis limicola]BAV32603.1 hypothetical protein SCL_0281 [Sulfuricaulis limicola]